MADERPRYFTLIDVFQSLFLVWWITVGCYVGWKAAGNLLAMFAGGAVGWLIVFAFVTYVRSRPARGVDQTPLEKHD